MAHPDALGTGASAENRMKRRALSVGPGACAALAGFAAVAQFAKALGIRILQPGLLRADRVIE